MSEVNLDDLRIDHEVADKTRSGSWAALIVLFILGIAVGICLKYFFPTLIPGISSPAQPVDSPGLAGSTTANEKMRKIETEKPEPSVETGFTEGGWVEVPSYHPVYVSALIAGRLDELNVLEGSKVKQGDLIAHLYDKDLKDTLTQAEAEVKVAEANLDRLKAGYRVQEVERARADLKSAEADLALKKEVLKRTQALVSSGAVSAEELDRDEAAYNMGEARRDTLQQELLLKEEGYRKEDIAAAEAALLEKKALCELAQNRLEYANIRSPMDGVVLERFVTPGTFIPANNPRIVSLYDPNDLQVRVDVRQEKIGSVFLGQKVEVFTEAEPDRAHAGTVIRIDPLADFKKNTIQAKIKLSNPSGHLHPEMIARIRFLGKDHDQDHDQEHGEDRAGD